VQLIFLLAAILLPKLYSQILTMGTGAETYSVVDLQDAGPGSLRYGIESARSPRTIVFETSGEIRLSKPLKISHPNLTIDGESAPDPGITITGWNVAVTNTHRVTIRYLRFRPGDINCPKLQDDAVTVDRSHDILIDHVSASWSIDEVLSVVHSGRVTVQWSIIAESLNQSCHLKGAHGCGSLIRYGDGQVTFHHNLFAQNRSRNPRIGDNIQLNFINNVIYNYGFKGGQATYTGPASEGITRINYIANYTIAGPSTDPGRRARTFNGGSTNTYIHQSGNLIDGNLNHQRDGIDTGWQAFTGQFTKQTDPFPGKSPPAEPATKAYEQVLQSAGASRHRDPTDLRILNDLRNDTGAILDKPIQ